MDWDNVVGLRRAFFGSPLQNIVRLGCAAGSLAQFIVLGRPVVLVNSGELAHEALVRNGDVFTVGQPDAAPRRAGLAPARGMFGRDGEAHRDRRRLVAPALRSHHFAAYAAAVAEAAEHAQAGWTDGGRVEILREMERIALDSVGRMALGWECLSGGDLGRAQRLIVRARLEGRATPARLPLRWRRPAQRRVRGAIARLRGAVEEAARARRATAGGDDLLSVLLRSQPDGTHDADVCEEILGMLEAGTANSATALAWGWTLLVRHPDIYARLRAEAVTVLGGRIPCYDDLSRLPYAGQVFREILRCVPREGAIQRWVGRDITLGGYTVPRGAMFCVFPYLLHHNPDVWADPERFDPARFAPEAEASLPRHAFLPFGLGTHRCVGDHFAMMQGQLVLAHLAQRVRLSLLSGVDVLPERFASPSSGGMRLRVSRLAPDASDVRP